MHAVLNERTEKIEERVAWLEHHVMQQDKEMMELAEMLNRTQRELLRLRERAVSLDENSLSAQAVEDRPPHY